MRVAIFGKSFEDNSIPHVQQLFNELAKLKANVICYDNFIPYLQKRIELPDGIRTFENHLGLREFNPHFLLSLGGDGTILSAFTFIRDANIPVLGINTGRLGFLSNVAKDHVKEAIQGLANQKFRIDKRNLISLKTEDKLFGELNFALNEFTVHKKDSSSMITINTYVNGEYLNSYWADGLIVSTPTGSTAYSLSCGGPIISPYSSNIIITPIAPHNLNVRPIVLSDDVSLKLVAEGRSQEFLITMDSRSETINNGTEMIIEKSPFQAQMVELEDHSFFRTIRHKLLWGIDKRN